MDATTKQRLAKYPTGGLNADWNSRVWFVSDTVVIFDLEDYDDEYQVLVYAWDDASGMQHTESLHTGTMPECLDYVDNTLMAFETFTASKQTLDFEQYKNSEAYQAYDDSAYAGVNSWIVYLGYLEIEKLNDGEYQLVVGNQCYKTGDLSELECLLYFHAVGLGAIVA